MIVRSGHFFIILILRLCLGVLFSKAEQVVDPITDRFTKIGITAAESIRHRGYLAEEHYFTTPDGYRLCLTRGRNPLFKYDGTSDNDVVNIKEPILFIHGILSHGSLWVANSPHVRPKDFTRLFGGITSSSDLKVHEFIKRIDNDPSMRSLPFLAMNLGHEVWLLNRRGTQKSEYRAGHLNRTVVEVLRAIPVTVFNSSIITNFGQKKRRAKNRKLDFVFRLLTKSLMLTQSMIMDAIKENFESVAHSFDPNYWAFTMDEQVAYDLPMAVDYVLAHSEPTDSGKVSIVAHSLGSALTLLTMSENRKFDAKSK